LAKSAPVIHEADAVLPSELEDFVAQYRDALAEVFAGQAVDLQDASCAQLHPPQRRLALQPCALIEVAVVELQPLREGLWVVREGIDDFVAEGGDVWLWRRLVGGRRRRVRRGRRRRCVVGLAGGEGNCYRAGSQHAGQ